MLVGEASLSSLIRKKRIPHLVVQELMVATGWSRHDVIHMSVLNCCLYQQKED